MTTQPSRPISEETKKALRDMGMTEYESRVYLALLEGGMMTASQVSESANVPYSKIYETLNSLEKKGWIETSHERPSHYFPKSPSEAFEAAKLQLKDKLDSWKRVIVSDLQPLYEKRELREKPDIWILRGEFNIIAKLQEMLAEAKSELMIATPFLARNLIETLAPALTRLQALPVKIQVMVTEKIWTKEMEALADFVEIRKRENMFGGGIIIDGKEAMLFLGEEKPSLVIWSNHTGLVKFAKDYFQYLWNSSKTKKGN